MKSVTIRHRYINTKYFQTFIHLQCLDIYNVYTSTTFRQPQCLYIYNAKAVASHCHVSKIVSTYAASKIVKKLYDLSRPIK